MNSKLCTVTDELENYIFEQSDGAQILGSLNLFESFAKTIQFFRSKTKTFRIVETSTYV